jgi:hypothetical protein
MMAPSGTPRTTSESPSFVAPGTVSGSDEPSSWPDVSLLRSAVRDAYARLARLRIFRLPLPSGAGSSSMCLPRPVQVSSSVCCHRLLAKLLNGCSARRLLRCPTAFETVS